jgi:peptidoglycan hydrolase-like protein with peptidoglycan-binding domain
MSVSTFFRSKRLGGMSSRVHRALRGLSRKRLLIGAISLATLFIGLAAMLGIGGSAGSDEGSVKSAATAVVARRDLVQRDVVSGTLGYADARGVRGQLSGTITALPEEGAVIGRGDVLYRVDEQPVALFLGDVPLWRALREGVDDGADVKQLELNLRALGYDDDHEMTIDRHFDWATTAAVEAWQEAAGLDATGVVPLGQIVFQPGERRVGSVSASIGDVAGSSQSQNQAASAPAPATASTASSLVLETTSTRQLVTAEIDARQQEDVQEGGDVLVDLPNGKTVSGKIATVSKVAKTPASSGQAEPASPTIAFEIELAQAVLEDGFDQTPVDVHVTSEKANGVKSVPVTALLALRGGGFGVEIAEGSATRIEAVTPGLYSDDGYVEIAGGHLAAGDKVTVPV